MGSWNNVQRVREYTISLDVRLVPGSVFIQFYYTPTLFPSSSQGWGIATMDRLIQLLPTLIALAKFSQTNLSKCSMSLVTVRLWTSVMPVRANCVARWVTDAWKSTACLWSSSITRESPWSRCALPSSSRCCSLIRCLCLSVSVSTALILCSWNCDHCACAFQHWSQSPGTKKRSCCYSNLSYLRGLQSEFGV